MSALGASNRVIYFDKRGTGLSDPIASTPTIDDFVSDTRAVLDESGCSSAVLVCCGEAGMFGPAVALAAPERVSGLVLLNAVPKVFATDGYAAGIPEFVARSFFDGVRADWGSEPVAQDLAAPSV